MNRQVRRIEEKKERKQEEAKAKAKAQRQARRRSRQEDRQRSRARAKDAEAKGGKGEDVTAEGGKASGGKGTGRRGSDPGRFSGALMIATVFFVTLQAVTPSDGLITTQIVAASFYLLFGYFATLWMMRRGSPRPVATAIGFGVALGIGTALSQWLQPTLTLAPIMLALIVPLLVAGAFLGRLVFVKAPR